MVLNSERKTIFIDIDGTLLEHIGSLSNILKATRQNVLANVLQKLEEWRWKEYYIVITTARAESMRKFTEEQLTKCGIAWDQLIMGLPHGPRVVINDTKPAIGDHGEMITAEAWSIPRNEGLGGVNI